MDTRLVIAIVLLALLGGRSVLAQLQPRALVEERARELVDDKPQPSRQVGLVNPVHELRARVEVLEAQVAELSRQVASLSAEKGRVQ